MEPIDIVFPCLDEAAALPRVLDSLPPRSRAIVVDNGSSDGSADVAAAAGALVVHEPRRGFGAAAHAGLLAATAPLVAFCDADASLDPRDLVPFREAITDGDADLVLGSRRAERGAWPMHARIANAVLARSNRRATGFRNTDLGPLRLARRERLLELDLRDRRSGYPLEMVLAAARAGWTVTELPVSYAPRVGRSKVTGTVRGTVTAVQDMSRLLRSHA